MEITQKVFEKSAIDYLTLPSELELISIADKVGYTKSHGLKFYFNKDSKKFKQLLKRYPRLKLPEVGDLAKVEKE